MNSESISSSTAAKLRRHRQWLALKEINERAYPFVLGLLALVSEARFHIIFSVLESPRGHSFAEDLVLACTVAFSSLLIGLTIIIAIRDRFALRALEAAGRVGLLVFYFREALVMIGLIWGLLIGIGAAAFYVPWMATITAGALVWSVAATVRVINLLLKLVVVPEPR